MPTRSAVSFLSRARVPLPLCPFVSLPSANATIASGLSAAMPAQEQNYWLETINAPSVEAAPDLPENVDVAIVGGGFCGFPRRALWPNVVCVLPYSRRKLSVGARAAATGVWS